MREKKKKEEETAHLLKTLPFLLVRAKSKMMMLQAKHLKILLMIMRRS